MKKAYQLKGRSKMLKKMFFSAALLSVLFAFLMILPTYAEGENIIKNPGFEEGTGSVPANWKFDAFDKKAGVTKYSIEGNAHSGSKCFVIENVEKNDTKLIQDVKVQLGKVYKISFWVKAENFAAGSAAGGNVTVLNGIYESKQTINTNGQWQKVEEYARVRSTGSDILNFALRVGGFGTTVTGKAYFDDIAMELVENPPAGAKVTDFFVPGEAKASSGGSQDNNPKSGSGKIIIILAVIVVVVGLLVFVEVKFAKRGHKGNGTSEKTAATFDDEDDDDEDDDDEDDDDDGDDYKEKKQKTESKASDKTSKNYD